MPGGNFVCGILERPFSKRHSSVERGGDRAIAADGEHHTLKFASFQDVGEVEIINVMTLDDVRVLLVDEFSALNEHLLFGHMFPVDDMFPSPVIRERYQNDTVFDAVGVTEGRSVTRV